MFNVLIVINPSRRKNHFEIEEVLRRKHTKKKFGVKVPKTNANRIKKTLEEDILIDDDDSGSDLEIIDYPGIPSNLSKIIERDTNDYTRTISPLSKIMKKVVVNNQIRKCDQFEQLNLTLEDEDGEESAVINNDCSIYTNTILTNNNIIDLRKEIIGSNNKNIYQKKLIAPNTAVRNNVNTNANDENSNNDISISLFSNVSVKNNHNPKNSNNLINKKDKELEKDLANKKQLSHIKIKSQYEDNNQEEKVIDIKDKVKNNNQSHSNSDLKGNDLQLIENYQKLKQLEQLQQFKDLEKMKELIDLNNTVNKLNGINSINALQSMFPIQQLPQMPIGMPYQSTLVTGSTIPTSPNTTQIQSTNGYNQPNTTLIDYNMNNSNCNNEGNINNSNANFAEPQSCSYCEEIYQYTIMNNLPFKKIKCLYCGIEMNSKTLEYYLEKFKKDLKLKYKNNIGLPKDKINEEDDNDKVDEDNEEEEERERIEMEQKRERERREQMPKPLIQNKNKIMPKPPRNKLPLKGRNNTEPSNMKRNQIIYTQADTEHIQDQEQEHEKEKDDQLINNNDGNISLAEAFRSKRAKILNKIEKRSNSVKENTLSTLLVSSTINEPLEMKILRQRRNQKLKLNQSDITSTAQDIKNNQSLNVSYTSRSKADPSPDLMNRLIKGEKAKMSPKEIKELNNRLYNKLVDVRAKKEDTSKKDELSKLNIAKRKYTNVSYPFIIS